MWAVWKVDLTVESSAVHLVAYLETLKVVCLVDQRVEHWVACSAEVKAVNLVDLMVVVKKCTTLE